MAKRKRTTTSPSSLGDLGIGDRALVDCDVCHGGRVWVRAGREYGPDRWVRYVRADGNLDERRQRFDYLPMSTPIHAFEERRHAVIGSDGETDPLKR